MGSRSWGSKRSAHGPWRSTCRRGARSSTCTSASLDASGAAIGSTASRTTDCCTTCWRGSTYPMTEAQELETSITRLFAERLEVEVPSPDLDLFQAGVVDSLLFVQLLAILEEQFGFRLAFDEREIAAFRPWRRTPHLVPAKPLIFAGGPPPRHDGVAAPD